ncbi:MAG: MFS transporter [Defluviitaleaceae bacterium]|nr:MFS transporter [Defluviitaleaceae bacterium]
MREMFIFLKNLKGNAKACVLTEPLWAVPFNLYWPFFTLYMFSLGVLDFQIGLLLTIERLLQVVFALLGGVITDKFGRRLSTLIFDIMSWSIPMLIWTFSQNFWWFLAASIVNSTRQVTTTSWECLLVEDDAENADKLSKIFNWIHISGQLAVFFAPIAGFFVAQYDLVTVVRVLLFITFVSMTAKFVILYIYSTETKPGIIRMKETKNTSFSQLLLGYGDVFKQILRSWKMMRVLALQGLIGTIIMISSTFFALYTTQNLGIPVHLMAYFPILRAAVMLGFLFLIQQRLGMFKPRHIMFTGILVFIAANGILLAAPIESVVWIAVFTVIEACATALLLPRLDTLAANVIDPKERARIRSFFNAAILAFMGLFGVLAGWFSEINRRLPFILNIVLFCLMLIVLVFGRKNASDTKPPVTPVGSA